MSLVVAGIGASFFLEGAANIVYWWNDNHPWYFQVGRALRTGLGFMLLAVGLWGV